MTTWWRTNRWYLLALAALIPAAVVVSLIPRWIPYAERLPRPQSVALGETVRYSGADIRLVDLEVWDGTRLDAPPGADVVVATLEFDVVDPVETYCVFELVSTEHGLERTWDAELYPDSDWDIPEGYESQCVLSEAGAYDVQVTFLVPSGQVEEPILQLTSNAALPRVLRLS